MGKTVLLEVRVNINHDVLQKAKIGFPKRFYLNIFKSNEYCYRTENLGIGLNPIMVPFDSDNLPQGGFVELCDGATGAQQAKTHAGLDFTKFPQWIQEGEYKYLKSLVKFSRKTWLQN